MVFTRGSRDDWDRWAEIIGDDAYSWDKMLLLYIDSPKNWCKTQKIRLRKDILTLLFTVTMAQCPIQHLDMNNGSPIGIGEPFEILILKDLD